MKTYVEIEWDEPQDENWLCPDNIKIALSAYCQNTQFKVRKLSEQVRTLQDQIDELAKTLRGNIELLGVPKVFIKHEHKNE